MGSLRNRFVAVLPAVALALFLASCGNSSEKKAAEAPQPAASSAVAEASQTSAPSPEASAASAAPSNKTQAAPPPDPASQAKAAEVQAQAQAAAVAAQAQAAAVAEAAVKAKAEAEAAKVVAAQAKAEAARVVALDVPDPVVATAGGVFGGPVTVTIEKKLKEAAINYTIDGTAPSPTAGLSYSGPFPVASSAVVRAIAFIPGGKKSGVVSAEYTIGEVCVAPGGSGDGRRGTPMGNFSGAIAKARSLGIGTVKIAAGRFDESLEVTAPILLSGSWKNNFAVQGAERTVLRAVGAASTTKKAPGYALRVAGKAADAKTRFLRIEFRGPDSSYGAGIFVADGASPDFESCSSFGGPGSYGYGAVVALSAAPTFRSCRLDGGDGATSYGLSVDNAQASVASSLVLAGTGTVGGYGASATDAKLSISDSVLAGNSANVSYGAAFYNSKGSTIQKSTIVGGSGKDVSGLFISTSNPGIVDCVVWANGTGKSYGITANYGDSAPSALSRSVFIGCAGGAYFDAGTKTAFKAFGSDGRLVGPDGKTPSKPQGEGNSLGSFVLGAAPSYAVPAGAAGSAGAGSDLLSAISR